ncbi:hypothetical protein VNO77_09995 [Canavalia gladiata]|uniref:Uncharacterized protein n=1 Tax=Canavalia gladiata TaxID=3824 RepID=A0AAN9QXB7_CANGL
MIMVVSMTEILGQYTAVLTRVTEHLFPRRTIRFGGLDNFRFSSTSSSSSSESASFLFISVETRRNSRDIVDAKKNKSRSKIWTCTVH